MGKATIVSGGNDGQYVVELDYGKAEAAEKTLKLNARRAEIVTELADLDTTKTEQSGTEATLLSSLDSAISAYKAMPEPRDSSRLKKASEDLSEIRAQIIVTDRQILLLKTQLAGIDTKLAEIAALTLEETKTVWCADLTEDGSGVVQTLEVNGEQPYILIRPGAPEVEGDRLFSRYLQDPIQIFFNGAILPGWQKWKPTYRFATITSINRPSDECNLDLEEAKSSAQDLDINQTTTLSDVEIDYLECNALAFEVGDEVVVEFTGQDWNSPKVIGFKDNPRPCYPDEYMFYVEPHLYRTVLETLPADSPSKNGGTNVLEQISTYPVRVERRYYSSDIAEPADEPYDFSIGDPPQSGSTPLSEADFNSQFVASAQKGKEHYDGRIRFDVAYVRQKLVGAAWEITSVETTDGDSYIMTCIAPTNAQSHLSFRNTEVSISTSTGDGGEFISAIDGAFDFEYTIYRSTRLIETMIASRDLTESDREAQSAWFQEAYTPPSTIEVLIDGSPVQYDFYRVGYGPIVPTRSVGSKLEQFRDVQPMLPYAQDPTMTPVTEAFPIKGELEGNLVHIFATYRRSGL